MTVEKICAECSDKHWDRWNNFDKHNPNATVDQWAAYWDKDYKWQLKQIENHCHKELIKQAVTMGENLPNARDNDWPKFIKD